MAKALRWQSQGRDVHIYFDNDAHGHAPLNAAQLIELIEKHSGEAPGEHPAESV
jgi:uncharacterized protein YecE (DUF72 family)